MSLAVQSILAQAHELVRRAEALGVTLRIDLVPLQPLSMGNHRHHVEAWPARHREQRAPAPQTQHTEFS
jgi:hypothetical protein